MKKRTDNKKMKPEENVNLPGYPVYPAGEDIYNNYKEEEDLDPEDVSKRKEPIEKDHSGKLNEKNFPQDMSGEDLDIPGSEMDELEENMGSEDEENNFYSLGGDDHDNLEEDNG
jgi:hypothetical protein